MREPDFSKGLLTAVVVDEHSKDVLMVAWMNEESYRQTLARKLGFGLAPAKSYGIKALQAVILSGLKR